jgi:hypothetical protein
VTRVGVTRQGLLNVENRGNITRGSVMLLADAIGSQIAVSCEKRVGTSEAFDAWNGAALSSRQVSVVNAEQRDEEERLGIVDIVAEDVHRVIRMEDHCRSTATLTRPVRGWNSFSIMPRRNGPDDVNGRFVPVINSRPGLESLRERFSINVEAQVLLLDIFSR